MAPPLRQLLRERLKAQEDETGIGAAPAASPLSKLLEERIRARFAPPPGDPLETDPGLLYKVGRVLDYPGRKVREGLSGRPEAEGRDILRDMGFLGPNMPGFDAGDVAGFAAEVALDPLTYVAGLGALTRGGKVVSQLLGVNKELRAALSAAKLARRAKQAEEARRATGLVTSLLERRRALQAAARQEGVPGRLQGGLAAQARAGQRAAVSVGVPFTGVERPLVRGPRLLGGLEKAGRGLQAVPGVAGLRRLVDTRFGKDPRARPFFEANERAIRRAKIGTKDLSPAILKRVEELVGKTGLPREEALTRLKSGREGIGVAGKVRKRIQDVLARQKAGFSAYRAREMARRGGRLKATAEKLQLEAAQKARVLEARADEALRGKGPRRAVTLRAAKLRAEAGKVLADAARRAQALIAKPAPGGLIARLAAREAQRTAVLKGRLAPIIQKARDASKAVSELGPMRPLAEDFRNILAEAHRQEVMTGAKASTNVLRALTKSYAERTLTVQAKDWIRKAGKWDDFENYLARRHTTKAGFQLKRREDLVEEFTADAEAWISQQKNLPKDMRWFELDPSKSLPERLLSGEVSKANAKLFAGLAEELGNIPHVEGKTILRSEFLARAPLHNFKGIALGPDAASIERRLTEAGMGGRGIPKEIADEAFAVMGKIAAPEEVKGLLKLWDATTSLYRGLLTVPFPAFHIRNLFSDTVLSWLGGGTDPRQFAAAIRSLKDPAHLRKMEELGILRGGAARFVYEQAREAGLTGAFRKRFPKTEQAARVYAEGVEAFTRSWHFLSKKAQGLSDLEAAASVKKYLLDYSDLTDFERTYAKRAVLFYNWPRKVIPRLLGAYMESPAKMALLTRATAQPTIPRDETAPEFAKRGGAIPIGTNEQGDPRFLFGTGSPLEEISRFDPSSDEGGILGGVKALGERVAQQLVPQIRVPAELVSGQDFFTGRDILDLDKAEPLLGKIPGIREAVGFREEKLPGGQTRFSGDPMALFVSRSLPTARLQRFIGQIVDAASNIDPKTAGGQNLAQALFGVKVTSQDPLDQARTLKRNLEALAQRFRRTGEIGAFPVLFAKGAKAERRPEILDLMERMRQAEKEAKRLRVETR